MSKVVYERICEPTFYSALEDEIEIAHVILTDYNDDPEMTEETTFFSEEDYVEYERLILQLKEFIDSRE